MKLAISKQFNTYDYIFSGEAKLDKFKVEDVEINYYFSYNQILIYKR